MSFFTSKREKRLWLWTLAVLVGIYASLGYARTLAGLLRDQGLITNAFWLALFLVGAVIVVQGLRLRPGGMELAVVLGIASVYLLVFLRMNIPEERSHIIEYSVLAVFILEALKERASQGARVPYPAGLALGVTVLLGLFDELIQLVLPKRVFDLRDIAFNALAALMAVVGSQALAWARRRRGEG